MWLRKTWSYFPTVWRCAQATFFCVTLLVHQTVSNAVSVQTVSGVLYAENFTYYKLSGEGWLRLELHSLKGDVDLYVSGSTLHPSFLNYELKSDTCGVDVVDIHSFVSRPVGIGLYAHPFYVESAYSLDIKVMKDVEVDEYEQLFRKFHYYTYPEYEDESKDESKSRTNRNILLEDDSEEEEEESIWWVILMTFLKFVLEIIV